MAVPPQSPPHRGKDQANRSPEQGAHPGAALALAEGRLIGHAGRSPEAGSVKALAQPSRAGVGGDRDGRAFRALGKQLGQQIGAAPAEFGATQLVEAEQAGAAVAGDGLGQLPTAVAVSSAPLFTLPAQINLSGAALTPPLHTGACEQNGCARRSATSSWSLSVTTCCLAWPQGRRYSNRFTRPLAVARRLFLPGIDAGGLP